MYDVVVVFALAFTSVSAQKYVGAKTCGMCHKKEKIGAQLTVWKKSAHANAFKTLQSKEADKIAKDKGYKTKAAETADCLKCHAPQHDVDKKLLGKRFKIEDGVQCETCHGPGSKYKSKKVMMDQKKAVAAGLKLYADPEKELCVKCHNSESPTFASFDFKKMWAKIEHKIPEKK